VLLCTRNHERLYRVDDVIVAFASLRAQWPEARLLLAGSGSQRPALECLVQHLGVSGVEFLGSVPPERMADVYDQADIFVNASDTDNMPLSILEASAAGLPVVSTGAGGIPMLVQDGITGLLTPVGQPEAIAGAVRRLLEEPGLALTLADAAYRRFMAEYTWEAVRAQWLACYAALEDGVEARGLKPAAGGSVA
jgi:glycosyltransferase involved in cell wall biosynthesis